MESILAYGWKTRLMVPAKPARLVGFVTILFFGSFSVAYANQTAHQTAIDYKQRGDYAKAYCIWSELAAKGDAEAQYNVGWMFHNGYGLAIDDQEALRYWELAAAQKHHDAWISLGTLYRLGGKGLKKDPVKAIQNFLAAAREGVDDAGDLVRVMLQQVDESMFEYRSAILQQHGAILGGGLKVTGDRANYREQASTGSKVLRVLNANSRLIELGRNGDWVNAATADDALVGWIHRSLVMSSDGS